MLAHRWNEIDDTAVSARNGMLKAGLGVRERTNGSSPGERRNET